MRTPLQINFRGMETSPALETLIRDKTVKLEQFHPNLTACRVVVDKPHQHKQQGKHFIVSIDLTVPGTSIVANHAHHEDVNVALRDAFFAARRQLEENAMRMRGDGKRYLEVPLAESAGEAQLEAEAQPRFD
ncbi:MAG: ribosome-associated translation inhibitor RaiA [Burkholderiaceae bacterium]|nr:ribosome-associated translation inhibitor RaiA [Burkholderiaceae bacterium]